MANEMSSTASANASKTKSGTRGSRKSSSLPSETVEYLKNWMMSPEHIAHPYPTEQEKVQMMADTGIELKQLTNWFVNNRKRFWKPRVEARLQNESPVATTVAPVAVAVAPSSPKGAQKSPVSPRANVDMKTVGNSLSRSSSHVSLVPTKMARICSQEHISTLHVVSETSSSVSDSASEGGDILESNQRDFGAAAPSQANESNVVPAYVGYKDGYGQEPPQDSPPLTPVRKRSSSIEDFGGLQTTRRKKFRRVSLETWRGACQEAPSAYCESLPTLEEATQLFGYAN